MQSPSELHVHAFQDDPRNIPVLAYAYISTTPRQVPTNSEYQPPVLCETTKPSNRYSHLPSKTLHKVTRWPNQMSIDISGSRSTISSKTTRNGSRRRNRQMPPFSTSFLLGNHRTICKQHSHGLVLVKIVHVGACLTANQVHWLQR